MRFCLQPKSNLKTPEDLETVFNSKFPFIQGFRVSDKRKQVD
jgi:hypothetical protein